MLRVKNLYVLLVYGLIDTVLTHDTGITVLRWASISQWVPEKKNQ